MTKPLGYYGASKQVAHNLDPDGKPPIVASDIAQRFFQSLEEEYPQMKNMTERDKKAIAKWVVNESPSFSTEGIY
ncbi:hypothetical protein [Okeania sp. SIO2B3]|uniref:hypothetical protein n=1 Tax=Okeania sp. SIO2B3 TaxID=2607784 RepID=UPI0013BFE032|nr:hypothetical protein [Okeania sp. SIO2B3]NET44859.1 hypothetical protein [Okeania sp. SIO2B3]